MNSFKIIAYPLLPISAMELLLGFLLLIQNRRSSPVHRSVAAIAFFSSAYSINTAVMYLMASRGYDFIFLRPVELDRVVRHSRRPAISLLSQVRSEPCARMVGYILYPYLDGHSGALPFHRSDRHAPVFAHTLHKPSGPP